MAYLDTLKMDHPRLMLHEERVDRMRHWLRPKTFVQRWYAYVKKEADELLESDLLVYELPDGLRLLDVSREMVRRVYALGLAYRVGGERKYGERLVAELLQVCGFVDWNPRHFLDVAEMLHGVGVGYDWVYGLLCEKEERLIRAAIIEKGLRPALWCYEHGDELENRWTRDINNWNQVCNTGIVIGALAVADKEGEVAERVLERAVSALPISLKQFEPDGGWFEGPIYWRFASEYTCHFLAAMNSALGHDGGLGELPGLSETGTFLVYMTGPSGKYFNFADGHEELIGTPQMLYMAERYGQQMYAAHHIQKGEMSETDLMYWHEGLEKLNGGRYEEAMRGVDLDKVFEPCNVVSMRSSWEDDAMYVGMSFSNNGLSHTHLDMGSFVLDYGGERFATELNADDYNAPGFFTKERYCFYRNRAEGHNTLVVDPVVGDLERDRDDGGIMEPDQNLPERGTSMKAELMEFKADDERCAVKVDLSAGYEPRLKRFERKMRLERKAKEVVVTDWVESDESSDVYWFMHTEAEVVLHHEGRRAILRRNGVNLVAEVLKPDGAVFHVRKAEGFDQNRTRGEKSNEGYRKLAVLLKTVMREQVVVRFRGIE
ncbi:Heparinase II/III-like protein [Poriferisphaera corsica]|uniref:Heparinase II/III-like protein n=1 Tax=Poriferisphaera corsica TaxID=2528020 RepID=A0A517YYW1_9BACT|nr:heparinase II/III family protein [Poriferisphaera corsica]QDU35408.1 Heparinase II/III-like protein [Poriferisphaera corsica]